jgi:nucleotide-binding universal stress UspA family protein
MTVVVWIVEGTWQACIDAARRFAHGTDVVLLHVTEEGPAAAVRGGWAGLLGRSQPAHDPGARIEEAAAASAAELLGAAADRLGRSARRISRSGVAAHEVTAACADADLLIVARDGDLRRLGPKSLGPATRFIVDHARCPLLLVWPDKAPPLASMPAHPPPPPPKHR